MIREQKIFELANELEFSDEIKIVSLCNNLKSPIQILEKNYSILEKNFERHHELDANKSLITIQVDKKIELIEYMNELNRLVHNYITSTQTLVCLQRNNYRALHETKNNFPEYQTKVNN